ncbi:Zinc finger protein 2 [Colletotrichum asianum]
MVNYCGSTTGSLDMSDFIIDMASCTPTSGSPDALIFASEVSSEDQQTFSKDHGIDSFDFNTIAKEGFVPVADDHGTQSSSPNPVALGQNLDVINPTPVGSAFEACSTCGRRCKSRRDLSEHRRCHKKRHQCPEMGCEMTFATLRDLTRHKGSMHEKVAQKCRYCAKSFRGRRHDNLKRHLRICRRNETQ